MADQARYQLGSVIKHNHSEVFCVRYSPDGVYLCASCNDGYLKVYKNGKEVYKFNAHGPNGIRTPSTCIRFKPPHSAQHKNVLLVASADGEVSHWHITSGQRLHVTSEEDNEVFAVDYNSSATLYATAGRDKAVRVYDETTHKLLATMQSGDGHEADGHSNRVFALKFAPNDPKVLVSGGWDNTLQIWDLRTYRAQGSIFGAYITGDSMDMHRDTILTGSCRAHDQIQLWDLGTRKLMNSVTWPNNPELRYCAGLIYACRFSHNGEWVAAGGASCQSAHIFDWKRDTVVGSLLGVAKSIYSADFHPMDDQMAFAGADGSVYCMDATKFTTLGENILQTDGE
eukprot:NODE_328_length_1629_cov_114.444740_g296_i0.p1 GENE.NODE_328_length_1629_cov_114.444740_g296_i0~~NODE_328_length_1629_cov_114.444740_g296_i0.p1  ORF type:complete len:364 (+),score=55.39 NODE_328_length_1629_cov_114.444740_g296_i0:70-1092(+)